MKKNALLISFFLLAFNVIAQDIDLLLIDRNYPEALKKIDENISVKPTGDLYFKRAFVFQQLEKYPEAVTDLEAALLLDPENSAYFGVLGDLNSTLGNTYEAVECYRNVLHSSPNDLVIKGKLGKAYISIDEFEKAYQVFEDIYQLDSLNVLYNKQYAYAAFKTGRIDQSVQLYEQILMDNPRDFGSHMNIISLYQKKRDTSLVYRSCQRALSEFPDNQALLLKKANTLFSLRDYQRARHPYEQYLASNDSLWEVMKNYGICLYFDSQEGKAIEVLNKCYYSMPNDQFVCFYLGLCYKKIADYKHSAEFLHASIALSQPSYLSEMYHYLGQVYGLARMFRESINALEKAYEYDRQNPEILFEIATTYEEYDYNKTHALAYYNSYLKEAGEMARSADYALDRIRKIKEDMFLSGELRE